MYHIKNDKRSYKSAELICEGLAERLKTKSYWEISITDVCAATGIARTTFYRLFDTLDDVLLYQFDSLFETALKEYIVPKQTGQSYAKLMLITAMKNPPLITAIISSGRNDLFDFATRAKESTIIQNLQLDINDTDRLYCTPMLNSMVFAALSTWVKEGCKETPDQLFSILKRNMKIICDNI